MTRNPVFITETARHILRHVHPDLKRAIRRALDELADHPATGKPLQAELAGLWSLRVLTTELFTGWMKQVSP